MVEKICSALCYVECVLKLFLALPSDGFSESNICRGESGRYLFLANLWGAFASLPWLRPISFLDVISLDSSFSGVLIEFE